jgi:amino acid transporter
VKYALPNLEPALLRWGVPGGMSALAALCAVVVTLLLCRRIQLLGWIGVVFCAGTMVTVLVVIGAGVTHFDRSLLKFPEGAFQPNLAFITGLGAAMRIAVYDYLGYYNICHLGDEVREPGRTIPRAVILSVVVIAAIYLTMNLSIIAVVPWQEAMQSQNVAALFMERLFGRGVATGFTALIVWTALACMFAITLGYSRIPYAAARAGDFFGIFARVHPRGHYPVISLVAVGGMTAIFCFFPLQKVIEAAVTVRILVQFIGQIVALHILRKTRPGVPLPFRMWLYPIPSVLALLGWIFLWATSGAELILAGLGVLVSGVVVFAVWRSLDKAPA